MAINSKFKTKPKAAKAAPPMKKTPSPKPSAKPAPTKKAPPKRTAPPPAKAEEEEYEVSDEASAEVDLSTASSNELFTDRKSVV